MFRNGLEPWHVILVVVVFVLLFGYKKLPDAARGLGKSLRILKSETKALREEGKEPAQPSADDRTAREGTAERRDALEHPGAAPGHTESRTEPGQVKNEQSTL
ncbi:Sec-independent protein translocase subunit TatA [Streptantibioticus parmotrematis]|uniref:Sec-independent protein translocase subunit TatA n=1 Tax=Streptantibioticus parmotrematis TaxID=2873249 RepID=UPI0033F3C17C